MPIVIFFAIFLAMLATISMGAFWIAIMIAVGTVWFFLTKEDTSGNNRDGK